MPYGLLQISLAFYTSELTLGQSSNPESRKNFSVNDFKEQCLLHTGIQRNFQMIWQCIWGN